MRIRSVLAAPLRIGDEPAAVLYLESRKVSRLFDQPEFELFQYILDLSARALERFLHDPIKRDCDVLR